MTSAFTILLTNSLTIIKKIKKINLLCPQRSTHRGYGIDHAVGDLILPHVLNHIKLSCSLLRDDLISNFLQFRVKLLEQIFKQQRQELENTHIYIRTRTFSLLLLSCQVFKLDVIVFSHSLALRSPGTLLFICSCL